MRRTRGQEIKRLQKKLIPVNLIVCILCIVAVLSLFFMPVVKINLAALVGDKTLRAMIADIAVEKVNAYIEQAGDSLDGSLGGNGGAENGGEQNNGDEPAARTADGAGDASDGGAVDGGNDGTADGSGENDGTADGTDGESEGSVSIKDLLKEIDVRELVEKLVGEIFDELKADISVSSQNSLKVLAAKDKADTLLNELFFNEAKGFITSLERTLVSGFGNAFNAAGKLVQGAVVKAVVVPALKENLPAEYAELVVAEELQATIDSLDGAKSAQAASDTIIDYIDGLAEASGEIEKLTEDQKAEVSKQITQLYDKTVAETGEGNFSVEAMISVMASEMLGGVGDFNLSDIIAGFVGGNGGNDGENGNGGTTPENPDGTDGEKPEAGIVKMLVLTRLALAEGEVDNGGAGGNDGAGEADGSDNDGGEVVKYTSYRAMGEGLARGFIGENFAQTLKGTIMSSVGENEQVFGYYGYVFIAIGFFILLWAILFLFSFFHMFARNKRFMMWYVKLFCAWPCIIFWLVPLLVKNVLATAFPQIYAQVIDLVVGFVGNALKITVTAEQATGLFNAVLSSLQTFAWISGICYLVLWIISICWAFPIKHKIRRLNKGY